AALLSAPALYLQWLVRRYCYLVGQESAAAAAGGTQLFVIVGGTMLLAHESLLSSASGVALLGVAGVCGSLLCLLILGLGSGMRNVDSTGSTKQVLQNHWRYGRWSLGVSLVTWARSNLVLFALPLLGGS